jgi:DNA-binding YbaB/EbfC family protein
MGGFNPRQLQEMMTAAKKQYEDIQRKMAETIVEGSAGGGSVTVKMNGQKHLLNVKIEPDVVQSGDMEMLQDLITAAVNDASRKVDEVMQSNVGGMLGGLQGLL